MVLRTKEAKTKASGPKHPHANQDKQYKQIKKIVNPQAGEERMNYCTLATFNDAPHRLPH